jgi:CTP synthase (UTP-ammonia lyase)
MTSRHARIALVGDRSDRVPAHARIPTALRDAAAAPDVVEPYWVASCDVALARELADVDGIWLVPGSPYADRDGAMAAVTVARTQGIPFLGTCGGFQHAVLEYARTVCGLYVDHAERPLDAGAVPIIVALTCSLLGEQDEVVVREGTCAAAVLGAGSRVERYFCAYGLDDGYRHRLTAAGLVFSADDATGAARMLELPGHPFFLATLFQPELSCDETWVHPLVRAFVAATLDRAADRVAVEAG